MSVWHSACAQEAPPPLLLNVVPAGGQAGTSVEVTVSGQNLDTTEGLYFSTPGIKAELITPPEPPEKSPKDPKKTKGTPAKGPKGMAPKGVRNSFKFKVTLADNARLGIHDVRVVTKGGISNPRAFAVGDLKEAQEVEPNDDVPVAQKIDLNSTVNGVIAAPTDVDYYAFNGKKGQRVVISCLTTSIDSKLPALVEVYGPAGNYLGSGRGYQENDAVIDVPISQDGEHHVRVACFTYTQGGPDYYYRLSVSTAPWIDAVYPPVVEAGKTTSVTVYGRNIPGGTRDPNMLLAGKALDKATLAVKAPGEPLATSRLDFTGYVPPKASGLDGFEFRSRNQAGASNPYLLDFAAAPIVVDNEKNDTPESAQQVTLPCEIAGRIEKKGDADWYSFSARKGDVYTIEAWADRLGVPMDLFFLLRNAKGTTITEQDDVQEVMSPVLFSRTYDPPRYRFVVPADGDYRLQVGSRDAFVEAGPRHIYRVRIAAEKPDFRLVAMPLGTQTPEASVLGQGGNQVFTIYAWRMDGFNGDITLTADGLPAGVTMKPQLIPAGQKQAAVVVSAAPDARPWTGAIRIVGTAVIGGDKLVREVRSATITYPVPQQNIPAISRLDRTLVLAVRDKAAFNLSLGKDQFVVPPGGKVAIPVKLTRYAAGAKANLQLAALNLPQGFTFPNFPLPAGKDSGDATLNIPNGARPGKYSIVLRAQTGVPGKPNPPKGPRLLAQPSTPVTIIVMPKQVAKLSVPTNIKLNIGKNTTIPVTLARLFEFDGPFTVELILPPDTKGLQGSGEVRVAADKSEAKVMLAAAADAPPGTRQNLVIRATAMFHGTAIVHEAKFNVNVVKTK